MEFNKGQSDEFVEFWNKHGITCKIRPMVSWGGDIEAPNLIKGLERIPCYWGMNVFVVTDTGDVAICPCDVDCTIKVDNIVNKSIEEVWNTSLKKFRDLHRSHQWDKLPEKCVKCMDWQSGYSEYK